MLGICIAADGNNEDEVAHCIQVSKDWAKQVRTGHLPRDLVWWSWHHILMKKHGYVLKASTFTEEECDQIMKPAIQTALSKSGIVCTLPRPI
jgi:hypothetical protein